MRKQLRSVSRRIMGIIVAGVVALSIPVETIAGCLVVVDFYNDQRRFPGEVHVECSFPHWWDSQGNGWGNWGVISNYGGVQDTDQFAGHKLVDHKKQWQSCTRRNPKPNCWYYNDQSCTAQKADPDNERKYASHSYFLPSGARCRTIGVLTINSVFMHVYELDAPDADDPVASLLYGDVDIPLSCTDTWSCRGGSAWIAATSGGGSLSARARIAVTTRFFIRPTGR